MYSAEVTISPILNQKGEIIFFVGGERDITKEKEIENAKTQFLSIASHELRTPLTAIDGLVSMILDGEYGEVNERLKDPLTDVNNSSQRLMHLVNDLLNISRIQAGRMKYTLTEFPIEKVILETIGLLRPLIKKNEVVLTAGDLHSTTLVQSDLDKIKQILNNVIGNALKFTDKGSITISVEDTQEFAKVHITDTGIGIRKEDQSKLFARFQQLQSGEGKPKGTGLGLHISREMMRKMGGDLWIEKSEENIGSTFAFSIPKSGSPAANTIKAIIEAEAKANLDQKSG